MLPNKNALPTIHPEILQCQNCQGEMLIRTGIRCVYVGCVQCLQLHKIKHDGTLVKLDAVNIEKEKKNSLRHEPSIPVGSVAKYKDTDWVISGVAWKKDKEQNRWFEYVLYNPQNGFQYLSESDGHFVWYAPIDHFVEFLGRSLRITYKEEEYLKFSNYKSEHLALYGEWPNNPNDENHLTQHDFIAAPHSIVVVEGNDERYPLHGTYLNPESLRTIFPDIASFPSRIGMAPSQPVALAASDRHLFSITAWMVLLLCVIQLIIIGIAGDEEGIVFDGYADLKSKQEYVSPPFEMPGRMGLAEIDLHTTLNNTWIYYDAFLLNEKTEEKFGISDETEFYYGVTDGEHWTEGNEHLRQVISGIPEGTYRLILSSEFQPEPFSDVRQIHMRVERLQYSMKNFWIILILLILPYFILRIMIRIKNHKRWYMSDYYHVHFEQDDE